MESAWTDSLHIDTKSKYFEKYIAFWANGGLVFVMVELAESGKWNSSVKIVYHQGDILENLDYQLEITFATKAP